MKTIYGTGGAVEIASTALLAIQAEVTCQNVNPLFVDMTHKAICDNTVSGILSLFQTQVVGGVFLLVTLHLQSFVRPYLTSSTAGKQEGSTSNGNEAAGKQDFGQGGEGVEMVSVEAHSDNVQMV
jgi:hypothetical protein